jgi:hypothetical protein
MKPKEKLLKISKEKACLYLKIKIIKIKSKILNSGFPLPKSIKVSNKYFKECLCLRAPINNQILIQTKIALFLATIISKLIKM